MMRVPAKAHAPDRRDYGLAVLIGLVALGVYVRTLAPDLLYGDSAEFQTLTYTLGTTHSTGYPIYLLLARLVGCLPLRSPAWRVNLFSALCGAGTVGGLYLLLRFLTPSRIGAALGSLALALTTTLWSQAIIAEVYTPGTAFLVAIMGLLAAWQLAPLARRPLLLGATVLACLGLGVHASVALIGPTALLFVLWVIAAQPRDRWWALLSRALLGFGIGIGAYFLAFILIDLHNPPSSFIQVMLYPSRSIWGLQSTDLDSVFERWWLTASGMQWQSVMFPDDGSGDTLALYIDRILSREFSVWTLLVAMLGLGALSPGAGRSGDTLPDTDPETPPASVVRLFLTAAPAVRLGIFMLATFIVMAVFVLNYHPGDQHIFFLPTYLLIATALGVGIGRILTWAQRLSTSRRHRNRIAYPLAIALCALIVFAPRAGERRDALEAGVAVFVEDTYVYPRDNLEEPRQFTRLRLQMLPEDAFLAMEWRALYTAYYLAHVEGMRPHMTIKEATPYGSDGQIADTLREEMVAAIDAGRPVYTDAIYPGLREHFRVMPSAGGRFYRLTPLRD